MSVCSATCFHGIVMRACVCRFICTAASSHSWLIQLRFYFNRIMYVTDRQLMPVAVKRLLLVVDWVSHASDRVGVTAVSLTTVLNTSQPTLPMSPRLCVEFTLSITTYHQSPTMEGAFVFIEEQPSFSMPK